MGLFLLKTILASLIISFCSWLSGKYPVLSGFIVALPLTTLIVLAFSYVEYSDPEKSTLLAKSVFFAIPVSLMFFAPFLISEKTKFGFWQNYLIGLSLLAVGYFIHRALSRFWVN